MRSNSEFQRDLTELWRTSIVPFQQFSVSSTSSCLSSPSLSPTSPSSASSLMSVRWTPFKRALAAGYSRVIPPVKLSSILDPLAPLLIDDKSGGVTLLRWLQFATYFCCEGWKIQDLWPPISFNAAVVLMEQPWFHGPISFNDTVDILLMYQSQLNAADTARRQQQQQQKSWLEPSPSSTSAQPSAPPMCYLLRYSETCWESNFWTLSFTTAKGVKSVRIAHHRANEETVMLYVSPGNPTSSAASPASSPALVTSTASSPLATSSPGQGFSLETPTATATPSGLIPPVPAGACHLSCVPLLRGTSTVTRFARPGNGGQHIPTLEESLISMDFFYILLPRQPGVLTVAYSTLTELLSSKYSSYLPANRRREYTDDPFAFFCNELTESSFR